LERGNYLGKGLLSAGHGEQLLFTFGCNTIGLIRFASVRLVGEGDRIIVLCA
jgi:hypothetical protein